MEKQVLGKIDANIKVECFTITGDKTFEFNFKNPLVSENDVFLRFSGTKQSTAFKNTLFIGADTRIPFKKVTNAMPDLTDWWIEDLYKDKKQILIVFAAASQMPLRVYYGDTLKFICKGAPQFVEVLQVDGKLLYLNNCSWIVIARKENQDA